MAEGSVGTRWAGRLRIFRYEIRRWRDGSIPDVDEAVESRLRLTEEPAVAQRVFDLVPLVPGHAPSVLCCAMQTPSPEYRPISGA